VGTENECASAVVSVRYVSSLVGGRHKVHDFVSGVSQFLVILFNKM
jgi:hypothetical protein